MADSLAANGICRLGKDRATWATRECAERDSNANTTPTSKLQQTLLSRAVVSGQQSEAQARCIFIDLLY